MLDIDRRQVLAYRVATQGLHRDVSDPADLGVLDLGIQGTSQLIATALAARLDDPPREITDRTRYAVLWSFRGAPHLHRRGDLPGLPGALWPIGETDAMARLGERKVFKDAAIAGLDALTAVTEAMRAVVTEPMTKGEVSGAVTARLPDAYAYDCRSCATRHVYGGILQQAGLFAGVELLPERSTTTLAPTPEQGPRPVDGSNAAGPTDLIRAYLRLHGPATLREAAGYLGTSQTAARPSWPDELVEVRVDGRAAWIPPERVEPLADPPDPPRVRLLPALDPYLQGRDRDLLVPDKARQKALWRILGNPGALLVDGEAAGVWRAKGSGQGLAKGSGQGLAITVQPFGKLAARVRRAVEAEAERMASARGAREATVSYEAG